MKRIIVATDFSTRSDRALRRASLMAQQISAEVLLVHVVDDDQAPQLIKAEQLAAESLLNDLAASLYTIDGVPCETRVVLGEPFQAIAEVASNADADVIVLGPHRRQALRDVFAGTTVERTIRWSRHPIIMANAVPAGRYDRVLLATDFSECSAVAAKEIQRLGLLDRVEVLVLHAFDAPARNMMTRSFMTVEAVKDYVAEEEKNAERALSRFLEEIDLQPNRQFLRLLEASASTMILDCAHKQKADLVVIGTHGRTGTAKFFLGSVAEEVLRAADIDVLVVPANRN